MILEALKTAPGLVKSLQAVASDLQLLWSKLASNNCWELMSRSLAKSRVRMLNRSRHSAPQTRTLAPMYAAWRSDSCSVERLLEDDMPLDAVSAWLGSFNEAQSGLLDR